MGVVALNVTVTHTEELTIGGVATSLSTLRDTTDASNLNFVAGQTIPNSVIAPVRRR